MNERTKLDKVFSLFIRLRDSDHRGIGRCISCGKSVHYKNADAGHYVSRSHTSTRWDEQNVNLQCKECNQIHYGALTDYANGLVRKYGEAILEVLSHRKQKTIKVSKNEMQELIKLYEVKANVLERQKS